MNFLQSLAAAFKGGGPRVPLPRPYTSPWIFPEIGANRQPYEYAARWLRLSGQSGGASRGAAGGRWHRRGAACPTDPALAALVTATSAGQSLLETLASQMLLHGNAYVQVLKDANGWPVELFALRPERVTLVRARMAGPRASPIAWASRC
jgi:hypothetical protein